MAQSSLRDQWHGGKAGCLSPWQQALALGLRAASKEIHGEANLPWICARVTKIGGGHPKPPSVWEFFEKVDSDKEWFPGKHNGNKRGPKALLSPAKRRCIANSAMAQKDRGDEPSVAETINKCPESTWNPKTKQPFCDKTIRSVFVEDCFDFDPEYPWRFQACLQKVFLPDDRWKEKRLQGTSFASPWSCSVFGAL